ncbi:hypothetical protein [Actinocrispum wychmicini]|uniref:Resolvase-like protein n=1 Tax=Actinocrispum wychmicini TaxID=1213861 RepID=A0A4R2JUU1_9PSEU|nr:hypothetical protein [Actinocrispum wychmicini]TCO61098.1 hypothetical protein EV192_103682 [Actinocrispum wychmicini]
MAGLTGLRFVEAVAARRHRSTQRSGQAAGGGVRFAFYGRMFTSEYQDPRMSRAWQRAVSDELVEGFGEVVVEFFDEGWSRRWSWWGSTSAPSMVISSGRWWPG